MNDNNETENKIYLVHRILSFEKKRLEGDLKSRTSVSTYLKQRLEADEEKTLEMVSQFNNIIANYNLTKIDFRKDSINEELEEFITFIINERIRKILDYLYMINLKDKYYLIFLPECPNYLIYDKFIIFSTTISNLEEDMIDYFNFIKENEVIQELILNTGINTFFKIDPKFDFISKFVDKFGFSYGEKPYAIALLDYLGEETSYFSTHILPGEKNIYVANKGSYSDLKFLVFIRKLYRSFK